MTAHQTELETGCPSRRIAIYLQENPGTVLTRTAVCALLQIAPAAAEPALAPGIERGLITCFNEEGEGRCWRAGPRLKHWQPDASAATPARGSRAQKERGSRYLPEVAISALKVHEEVPLPAARSGRMALGTTRYDQHFALLQRDGQCVLSFPRAYKSALKKAAVKYLQHRPTLARQSVLVVRDVDPTHVGVWRVAKGTPGAVAHRPAGGKAK